MTLKILALGVDGIGPEVVQAALEVLEVAAAMADAIIKQFRLL